MQPDDKKIRSLMKKTLALLKQDTRTPLKIAIESNINYFWLRKFKAGGFRDPSVNTVQQLWEHLSQRKLPL